MLNDIRCGCGKNKVEFSQVYKIAVANLWYLIEQSPKYDTWYFSQFNRIFSPALKLKQYKFWFNDQEPVGFVCWMWLGDDASRKYAKNVEGDRLQPEDWSPESDDSHLWISELICTDGNVRRIIKWLHRKFPDRQAYHTRHGKFDGEVRGKYGKKVIHYVAS